MDMRTGEMMRLTREDLNGMSRGQRRHLVALTDAEALQMQARTPAERADWAKVQPRTSEPHTTTPPPPRRFKSRNRQSR